MNVPVMDSKWTKMVISGAGTIDQQALLIHLYPTPTDGDAETLAREAIFINSCKDNMKLLEIQESGRKTNIAEHQRDHSKTKNPNKTPL